MMDIREPGRKRKLDPRFFRPYIPDMERETDPGYLRLCDACCDGSGTAKEMVKTRRLHLRHLRLGVQVLRRRRQAVREPHPRAGHP